MADAKPSFFQSMRKGMMGYVKGALVGIAVGIVGGAALGALIGAFTLAGPAAGAILGATWLAGTSGVVGALSGMMTEIVRSREVAQVSGQDVANVANIAFAQGMSIGHERALAAPEKSAAESRHFRNLVEQQRGQSPLQSKAIH